MKRFHFFLVALIFIGVTGCKKDDDATPVTKEGKFELGQFQTLTNKTIGKNGGEILIDQEFDVYKFLKLEIPDGAYDSDLDHAISFAPILSSTFPDIIRPLGPILRIENGEVASNKPILITIGVQANPSEITGAFYYEAETGELHGIPVVRRGHDFVQIMVWHFSEIILSQVKREEIQKLRSYNVPFDLKENYWNFGNILTHLGRDGMCSGMTLAASYLYGHPDIKGGFDLYFDNNPELFQTPDYPLDDALGIRFASTLQKRYESFMQMTYNYEYLDAASMFWSTAYYIYYKKRPQMMVLGGPKEGNHAVLVTGFEAQDTVSGNLIIVDPNFYPSAYRTIVYSNGNFEKYLSSANMVELAKNNFYEFTDFVLFPDYKFKRDELDKLWGLVKSGASSNEYYVYPKVSYYAHDASNPDGGKVLLQDLLSGKDNYLDFERIIFSAEEEEQTIPLILFAQYGSSYSGLRYEDPMQSSLDLTDSSWIVGLGTWSDFQADYKYRKWMDFKWFVVRKRSFWIEPSDTNIAVNTELKMTLRHNNTAPRKARYEWDFGDGNEMNSSDSIVMHKFETPGEFKIKVKVFDQDKNVLVAEAETGIKVTIWPKISISLRGSDGLSPSTIKTNEGADIVRIDWSNKVLTDIPLSWNKTDFEIDFNFTQSQVDFTCRIYGKMTDDFSKILYLNAIFTGMRDAFTYQSAIVIENFPMAVVIPEKTIGKVLKGTQAQSVVKQLSWRQTSEFQGKPVVQELGSVDWSSNKTELSVYFYDR